MSAVFSKVEIESGISERFGDAFRIQKKPAAEFLQTGVEEIDSLIGGVPRGAITEIFGLNSSGRTSLVYSMFAYASTHDEICALVDTNNVFAPCAAVCAGIDFDRLLWIRCASNIEHAFKATDLLLHAGGFGLIVLDMGDVAGNDVRRIISSWWYRFRRTVENKPTAIIVLTQESATRSCAALALELSGAARWSNTFEDSERTFERNVEQFQNRIFKGKAVRVAHANLLQLNSIKFSRRRPITPGLNEDQFHAQNYF